MRYAEYPDEVVRDLWTWADRRHWNELDDGKWQGRPHVLSIGTMPEPVDYPCQTVLWLLDVRGGHWDPLTWATPAAAA